MNDSGPGVFGLTIYRATHVANELDQGFGRFRDAVIGPDRVVELSDATSVGALQSARADQLQWKRLRHKPNDGSAVKSSRGECTQTPL